MIDTHISLREIRRRLTLLFTGIVVLLVFVFGSIFLFGKYIQESREERTSFQRDVGIIKEQARKQQLESLREILPNTKIGERLRRQQLQAEKYISPETSILLLDREKNILYKRIVDQPHFDEIDFQNRFSYQNGTIVFIEQQKNTNTLVIYKNIRVTGEELLRDILILLCAVIFAGGAFYFVGRIFVGRVLIPIGENIQSMKDFTHHAGHELKTPLAVLRGNLQVMQAEEEFDKKLLKSSLSNIDNMVSTIEGLRELSEIGSLSDKKSLSLTGEIQKTLDLYLGDIQDKKLELIKEIDSTYIVNTNQEELSILLTNLVQNAVKYSQKSGELRVKLERNIFSLENSGKIILNSEKDKVFERFYRAGNAQGSIGSGIGLSLVKSIAQRNKWKIELESVEGKTKFTITF